MTSFNMNTSSSAPDILDYDSETILNNDIKINITRTQNKSTSIIEDDSSNYKKHTVYQPTENERFLSAPISDKQERNNSLILDNFHDKNSRHYHFRSEMNSFRKARRRAVFKNGDCNVVQVHISERGRRYLQDLFTTLVDAKWRWTFLAFVMSFILSWFAFALLWWLITYSHGDLLSENQNNTNWIPCIQGINGFLSSFLFSIETQHSTGYGTRSPTAECVEATILLCIQSIIGVMIQAFMVGIVFAKMARPKQRKQTLLFSRNSVICQRDGELCLMFRVGDMREKSHLINSTIRLYLIQSKHTQEGEILTPYIKELSVQVDDYNENVFLIWPLTIIHKINANSPLYEMSAAELLYERFEIVAVLEGTTESTGQTTQILTSYVASEILWGHRFQSITKYNKEKLCYEVDFDLFHDTYQVDTPLCSAEELQHYLQNQLSST